MKKILLSLVSVFIASMAMAQTQISWTWEDWEGVTQQSVNDDGTVKTQGSDVISFSKDGFGIVVNKNSGSTAPTVAGGYQGANDLRVYAKGTLAFTNAGGNITKMVFHVSTQGKKRLTDVAVTSGDVVVDTDAWTVTWTGSASEVTFTVGDKCVYGSDGTTKAGQFDVDDVVVTAEGMDAQKLSAGLKWSATSVTVEQGAAFTAPTFSKSTTADVTFTTSDDEVAVVDANGVITLGGELGVATITATSAENDEYFAGEATVTITVNAAPEAIEITSAKAAEIALALSSNNTPTTETYTVTGYVTDTNGTVSKGQQIFWMADTKDGGKVFEGYWANIPNADEPLNVGDKIKMTGKLMKYNTTPEMKNGTVEIVERSTEEVETIVATAAEAYAVGAALADGESTKEFYDVTAYVATITSAYSNGAESFTLTDTKGTNGEGLVAYKAYLAEAALEGAKVRVVGKIKNYGGTIEFDSPKGEILEQGEATVIGGLDTFENGGFENWITNAIATGWQSTTTASTTATVERSEDAHSGNYAALVKHTASSNKRIASKEMILPAGSYTFEFYAKAATETPAQVRPGIAPWDAANKAMGTYVYGDFVNVTNAEWTHVVYTFELTEETQINLVVMNPKDTTTKDEEGNEVQNTSADALIDDASLYVTGETPVVVGDANSDGAVTMADANKIVNYFTTSSAEGIDLKAADVTGEGEVTMADANAVVNIYVGSGE